MENAKCHVALSNLCKRPLQAWQGRVLSFAMEIVFMVFYLSGLLLNMSIFLCYSLEIYYILITILYKLHLYQIYLNIYYFLQLIATTACWSIDLPEEFFPIQVFTESSLIFSDFLFMVICFYSVKR